MKQKIQWNDAERLVVFNEMDRLLGLNWDSSNAKLLDEAQHKLSHERQRGFVPSTIYVEMQKFKAWRKAGKPASVKMAPKKLGRPTKQKQKLAINFCPMCAFDFRNFKNANFCPGCGFKVSAAKI